MDAVPFRGLRFDPTTTGGQSTAKVTSTARKLVAADRDPQRAAALLEGWLSSGALVSDGAAAFYRYDQQGRSGSLRGVLAAVRLTPLDREGDLVPHERVYPELVHARAERLAAAPLEVSPIFALCTGAGPAWRSTLDRRMDLDSVLSLTDEAGRAHRIWRVAGDEAQALRASLSAARAVIADGHHRYAAALAYRERRGAEEEGPWQRALVYLVDPDRGGPSVRPVHRFVRAEEPPTAERLRAELRCEPAPLDVAELLGALARAARPTVAVRFSDEAMLVRPRTPGGSGVSPHQIDALFLSQEVAPALGVDDPQLVPELDPARAVREMRGGASGPLLLVRAVAPRSVVDLALGGTQLPPKTTWFYPKPRAGLLMRMAG